MIRLFCLPCPPLALNETLISPASPGAITSELRSVPVQPHEVPTLFILIVSNDTFLKEYIWVITLSDFIVPKLYSISENSNPGFISIIFISSTCEKPLIAQHNIRKNNI